MSAFSVGLSNGVIGRIMPPVVRNAGPGASNRRIDERSLPMATLHVQLLGDFRVSDENSHVLNFSSPRLQTLLAYLLLHRRAQQSRQHIAFVLWPDSSETQARANLRWLLKELKRALPDADAYLSSEGQALQWRADAPCALDVDELERAADDAASAARDADSAAQRTALVNCVSLYTGDLMPSCYDDWLLVERERLQQLHIDSLLRLVALLERSGDYRDAIGYTQRLLHIDPLREDSYRQLMRLHALNGERAGVQRVYNQCVMVLQRELAIEPSAETRKAYEHCLRIETAPHTNSEEKVVPDQPAPQAPRPPMRNQQRNIQYAKDALTFTLPTAGLGYSVLALNAPLLIALPLSIAAFLGLYLLLNPRSASEQARADIHAEVSSKLDACQSAVYQLRALAAALSGTQEERIRRIADLADGVIGLLRTSPAAHLRDAHTLAHILSQASQIVELHSRLAHETQSTADQELQSRYEALVGKLETSLREFAKRVERPDRLNLEVAMRALLNLLKQEGLDDDDQAGQDDDDQAGQDDDDRRQT